MLAKHFLMTCHRSCGTTTRCCCALRSSPHASCTITHQRIAATAYFALKVPTPQLYIAVIVAAAEHLVALAPVAPLWLGPLLVGVKYLPGLASLVAHYLASLDARSAAAVRTTAAITNIRYPQALVG